MRAKKLLEVIPAVDRQGMDIRGQFLTLARINEMKALPNPQNRFIYIR